MESSDLYRMIEALLASSGQTAGSNAASNGPGQSLEDLVRAPAPAPVVETPATKSTAQKSDGPGIGETIAGMLLGGLPLFSLFKGLFDSGNSEDTLPPLVKYQLPTAVNESLGYSANAGFVPLEYTQNGLPRAQASSTPQVTVQVNAMDSRSFLDHSEEIANAVREAVLNSNSLRDVLTEL